MTRLRNILELSFDELAGSRLERVKVAVLDSGIDGAHPALAGRIEDAWGVARDDSGSYGLVCRSPTENNDCFGHGTAVAGIIAATAPNAVLSDVCILESRPTGAGEATLAALTAAVEGDARVLNLSLACKARLAPELNALCEKAYRNGKIVVAAKRNRPLSDLGFPAEFSSCISVDISPAGAFRNLAYRALPPIEFAAAGEDVPALAPGGLYTRVTGTSFATPVISGLCALLLGRFPDLTPFELKTLLKHHASGGSADPGDTAAAASGRADEAASS